MWTAIGAFLQGLLKLLGMADKAQTAALEKTQQGTGARLQQGTDMAASLQAQQRADTGAANAPTTEDEFQAKAQKGDL